MKIVQVIHSFPPYTVAGSETYTYNLSRQLLRTHKVYIFHRINNSRLKEYECIHSNTNGLDIYSINNTFNYCNSFEMTYRNKIIAEKFGAFLNEVKPDVIHIQHLLFLSTTLIEEAKKRNIPVIFTLHDYWLLCQQGQLLRKGTRICNNGDYSNCADCLLYLLSLKKGIMRVYQALHRIGIPDVLIQLLKKSYYSYARLSSLPREKMVSLLQDRTAHFKHICKLVDKFTAPSQFLRKRFVEFGIPENRIIFSRYGFNTDLFKGVKKENADKIRFGFVGTLLPAKGVHLLIDAFNRVKEDSAELNIYGRLFAYKGFERYPRYIKRLAKNKNIRFMGGYDNKDIAQVLSKIDVLVIPSIWYENSPLVIQEAFLAKIPVIASNIGGIPELVRDGENGLLFEPANSKDLYEKVKLILDNPQLIEELKANIHPPKSIEENAREVEMLYRDLARKQ